MGSKHRRRRKSIVTFLVLGSAACGGGPTAATAIPEVVTIDGVRFEATAHGGGDSLRVIVRLTNTRPYPMEVGLGGCLVTVILYRVDARPAERPAWDEREGLGCPDALGLYPLGPGEQEELVHAPLSANGLGEPIPRGEHYAVARVTLTLSPRDSTGVRQSEEILLLAGQVNTGR